MRVKTTSTTVYKFSELPEDAQDKAIEKLSDINFTGEWWDYDGKTGFSEAEMKKYGLTLDEASDLLTYKKLYFDLDRGAFIQFVDAEFANVKQAQKYLQVTPELWAKVDWSIIDQPGRNGNTRLEWEWADYDNDPTPAEESILDHAVEQFADKVSEALSDLQKQAEWQGSREAIVETIEINEYEFDINGNIC